MHKYLMFRFVPTMKCNYRCPYCFLSHNEKTGPSMFDHYTPAEWIEGMKKWSNYEVEFYCWGGEPFLLDGTYEVVRGWTAQNHVRSGCRLDTNMYFADKIAERCPTDKIKLNCSWHTKYDTLEEILRKARRLQQLGMVGMVNFVASPQNLEELKLKYQMSIEQLIQKFDAAGIFINIAADFNLANDLNNDPKGEYKRMVQGYVSEEDWRQLRCEKQETTCLANHHFFTVHHNGDITPCLSQEVCGNFFAGTLNPLPLVVCTKNCPSLVAYPFRMDNAFPMRGHLIEYVSRSKELRHPASSGSDTTIGIANVAQELGRPGALQIAKLPSVKIINGQGEFSLNFAERQEQIAFLARYIQKRFPAPSMRIGITYPLSPMLILIWLSILKAGKIPCLLPSPMEKSSGESWSETALNSVRICELEGVIGDDDPQLAVLESAVDLCRLEWNIATLGRVREVGGTIPEGSVIQLASGINGQKKALQFSLAQIVDHGDRYDSVMHWTAGDRVVSSLPIQSSAGFFAGFVLPLLKGVPITLIDPMVWEKNPQQLFETIKAHQGTICYLLNSGFEVMSRRDARGRLESMRLWISCSEPSRWNTLRNFAERTGTSLNKIATCYSKAENIFAVCQSESSRSLSIDSQTVVSCGKPLAGTSVKIVKGEIYVKGPSSLRSNLDKGAHVDSEGYYATGDHGYLVNGELGLGNKNEASLDGQKCAVPTQPKVTVVLPAYNHVQFLPRAIQSILDQTFSNFELIVVNDGSTDGTKAYLDGLTDPRIRVFHQENRRLPQALNRGFAEARGEYFTWVSADNYESPLFLQALTSALEANPDVGFAYSSFAWIDEQDQITGIHQDQNFQWHSVLITNPGVAAFLYRRSCVETVGGYDPSIEGAEDWDMWLRILEKYSAVYVPEILCYYRLHAQSMTVQKRPKVLSSAAEVFRRALERQPGNLDLDRLYPAIGKCENRRLARICAQLDFSRRLLRCPWAPPQMAVQFLKAARTETNDIMVLAHLAMAYGQAGCWSQVDSTLAEVSGVSNPIIQNWIQQIQEARKSENAQILWRMPLISWDEGRIEVLRLGKELRRVYSVTLSKESAVQKDPITAKKEVTANAAAVAVAEANECHRKGDLAGAKECLTRAHQSAPNDLDILESLGSVLFQLEDYVTAGQQFARVCQADARRVSSFVKLAYAELKLDHIEEFESAIGQALDLDPKNLEALHLLASLSLQSENYADAARFLQRILACKPDDVNSLLDLGACFIALGDVETARLSFQEALKYQPDNPIAHNKLASLTANDTPKPCLCAAAPLASGAKFKDEPEDHRLHLLLQEAEAAYSRGDLAVALETMREASKLAPQSMLVLKSQGNIAFLAGDYAKALETFQLVLIRCPDKADLLVRIAMAAMKLNKYELFECALDRALEIDPKQPEGLRLLADLNLQQRNFAAAVGYYHRLLQLNAGDIDVLQSLAFCLFQGQKYDTAATTYERILALDSTNELARENLRVVRARIASAKIPEAKPAPLSNSVTEEKGATPKVTPSKVEISNSESKPEVAPLVSIIILAWNQLAHTRACLESLQKYTPEPHEVILVDNGSTDGTPAYLLEQTRLNPGYVTILNRANRGFAAGNNQGLRIAKGKNVLLLNNDTVLTEGWLSRMLAVLEDHADTGIVGPVTNCISGPQLISPVHYDSLVGMQDFAAQWAENNEGKSIEINRVVGFCLLARREVIERIGGLDEQFGSGNFEDDDFCIRSRACGFKARIARAAFIHHAGSQTFKGAKIDYSSSMRRNWELFKAKYHLPADALVEKGYRMPLLDWNKALYVALPELGKDHTFDAATRVWQDLSEAPAASAPVMVAENTPAVFSQAPSEFDTKLDIPILPMPATPMAAAPAMQLPATALVGRLKNAYDLLGQGDLLGAWKAGLQALKLRPFHPEAYVMLGQTAQTAGHIELARQCGQRALQLTPAYDLALNFIAHLPAKGKKRKTVWPALPVVKAGTLPTLTVCVIAKNEEQFIGQCLRSIRPLAHQIVLLDTGSTDRTIEIAKELGAEVHSFTWNDNFSDARNAALEHARGDWVLCLDADEEILPVEHAKFNEVMNNPSAIGCRLPLTNCGLNEAGGSFVPRMFRNAPGLFFIGRVHEQVFPSVLARASEWKMRTVLGGGEIRHHGYATAVMNSRNKIERNLKLLQQAVVEMPGEPHLVMNLGLELTRSGMPEEGLEQYREAFRLMSKQEQRLLVPELREALLTQFPVSLMARKLYEEAIEVLSSPLAVLEGQTASMHYALGGSYFQLRQFEKVVEQMTQCLAKRNVPANWPLIREVLGVTPRRYLANSLVLCGRTEEAMKAYREALQEDAENRPLRLDFARFLHQQKESVEALNILHQLVKDDATDPGVWVLGGSIALGSPDFFEVAMDWTAQAIHHHPESAEIQAQRAEFLLLGQEAAQALELWENIPGSKLETEVAKLICRLAACDGHEITMSTPVGTELELSREFIRWYRRFLSWQGIEIIQAINANVAVLKKVLPSAAQVISSAMSAAKKAEADSHIVISR